jgi:DNA-binding response OmpR family regulator
LDSLVLSRDMEMLRVLRPTLEKLSIEVKICQEAKQARDMLIAEKFDAVIVDCDELTGGREVLQGLRATSCNRHSVSFAVLNGKKMTTQEAFGMGVNFVLQKPVTNLNAARCFSAALSFMERERRRYCRQPVEMPVRLVLDEKELKATSTNISEGGIALMSHQALPTSGQCRVQFTLPKTTTAFDVEAEVAWANIKGHAGLRFHNVAQSSQERLDQWLSQQAEQAVSSSSKEKPAGSSPEAT